LEQRDAKLFVCVRTKRADSTTGLFSVALSHKKKSRAIAKAVVDLARGLHLDVIAERIETEDQLEQVRKLGLWVLRFSGWQEDTFAPVNPTRGQ
jgi:predicted signal transduction protein with EAL and GGDEF domain